MLDAYDVVWVSSLEKKGVVIHVVDDLTYGRKRVVCFVGDEQWIVTDEEDVRFIADMEGALKDALEYYHGREA